MVAADGRRLRASVCVDCELLVVGLWVEKNVNWAGTLLSILFDLYPISLFQPYACPGRWPIADSNQYRYAIRPSYFRFNISPLPCPAASCTLLLIISRFIG